LQKLHRLFGKIKLKLKLKIKTKRKERGRERKEQKEERKLEYTNYKELKHVLSSNIVMYILGCIMDF
jgi:hypothetical protein